MLSDRVHIKTALQNFTQWAAKNGTVVYWCNGMNFDFPIIEWACIELEVKLPWKYYNMRDTRTIYKLADINTKTGKHRVGEPHNALDDCISQVNFLKEALT